MIDVTDQEVKRCSRCSQDKALVDFSRCRASKDGRKPHCKICGAQLTKNWVRRNPQKKHDADAAYWAANKIRLRKSRQKWYLANRGRVKAIWVLEYGRNRIAYLIRSAKWRRENPEKFAAQMAKRRAAELQAIPTWADLTAIEEMYTARNAAIELFNADIEVDHVIPLQSKRVCGLHCAENLQLLLRKNNRAKSNQYWPDMP